MSLQQKARKRGTTTTTKKKEIGPSKQWQTLVMGSKELMYTIKSIERTCRFFFPSVFWLYYKAHLMS